MFFFIISTIASNCLVTPDLNEVLPELNKIDLAVKLITSLSSSEITGSGHPLLDAGPTTFLQLSSLSNTPSPSVSGQGHPLLAAGPQ